MIVILVLPMAAHPNSLQPPWPANFGYGTEFFPSGEENAGGITYNFTPACYFLFVHFKSVYPSEVAVSSFNETGLLQNGTMYFSVTPYWDSGVSLSGQAAVYLPDGGVVEIWVINPEPQPNVIYEGDATEPCL